MRNHSLALISAIALCINAAGAGLAPLPAVAAPAPDPAPASLGALPAWFAATPDDKQAAADPETTTGSDGHYRFEGLPHGTHKVTLDPATLPLPLRPTEGDPVPILWLTPGMERTSAPLSTGVRFTGVYDRASGTISGLVFLDLDSDGQVDPGEPGLPGVRVIDPTLHQYYVPFNDVDLWALFEGKASCHGPRYRACAPLVSNVFLTAGSDATTYYYDHWEDGYDDDPLDPGPTTEVGVLGAGATQTFQDAIDPTQVSDPDVFFYDGRDRLTVVGEAAQVVRLANASSFSINGSCPGPGNSSTWLAGAWEVPEVARWGTEYISTVGEDLNYSGGAPDDHDFSGLEVMAWQDGTQVFYNDDPPVTLEAGGVFFVNGANDGAGGAGGADSTDIITATAPIQVQMVTGACSTRSEEFVSAHGYTLQPLDMWGNAYWAPVPGFLAGPYCSRDAGDVDTDIYLHNHHPNPIVVNVSSNAGTADLSIDPHTTISVLYETGWEDISSGIQGLRMSSPETFWGVSVVDSSTNRATGGESTAADDYDWGYSLLPACQCSSQVVVGYAPGRPTPPLDNGSLAFVTAVTDTVVYVDLNQDGLPDPFDMNGDGDRNDNNTWGVAAWDEPTSALGIPLQAGQVLRVGDPNDQNLMGARIYTTELEDKISVAWGQDPCRSTVTAYLDLGYTVLPTPIPRLSKIDDLAIDADLSGGVSPGDTITYTLVLYNNGKGPMSDVVLTDPLPYTYTSYVVGSLQVTTPPSNYVREYSNDGVNFGDPESPDIRALRVRWPTIEAEQTVTVTFRVILDTDMPVDVTEITNQATVDSAETDPRLSEDPDDPPDPDTDTPVERPLLSIDKRVSPTVVSPGDLVTYTMVVSNYGNGVALLTQVTDVLPAEVTYVPGTLDLAWPIAEVEVTTWEVTETASFKGYYADDFDLSATESTYYSGNDGSLTWSTDWTELGDDGLPGSGEVQVRMDGNGLSEPAHLWMANTDGDEAGVRRTLDLSEFRAPRLRYYVSGNSDANYRVTVTGIGDFAEAYSGDYAIRELDISAAAGNPAAILSFFATSAMDPGEFYRFDHISIYETDPLREVTRTLTRESVVLSYRTSTDGDPVSYNSVTGQMVITEGMRLPAGGYFTATFQAQVDSPLPDGVNLGNTACTTATNWLQILSPPCDDASVLVRSSHALTITKSADPPTVAVGGLLTYTLNYVITGDEAVESMVVRDSTPANTTFHAAAPTSTPTATLVSAPIVGGTGPVVWRVSGLWPPGSGISRASGTLRMVVRLDSDLTGGTPIYNAVTISDTTGLTDTDEITTPVQAMADLAISKVDNPDPVVPGSPLTYTLQVVNNGPSEAEGVTVTDTLPSEVTFVSATPTQVSGPNPLVWDLGTMTVGETRLIAVVVEVQQWVTQTFTNTASVGSDTPDDNPDNNYDEEPTRPPTPMLELVKTVNPGRTVPGMPFTYTLQVANTGDMTFNPLVLTDTLPANFYYLSGSGDPSDPDETSGDVSTGLILAWRNLGPLAPGGNLAITFQVTTPLTIGTYTNTATVAGTYPGGTLTDSDEAPIVVSDPEVAVDKRLTGADRDDVAPNYVTFTIGIANVGPSTIDVLPLLDEYDTSYLSFADATPYPEEDADDGLLTWRDLTGPGPHGFGRNLRPGETVTVTTIFRVVRDIDFTVNTATVTGAVDVYGNPADPVEDEYPLGGIPTAIQVVSFYAVAEASAVRLEWETVSEWDCAGFRVYRDVDAGFDGAQIIASVDARGPGSTYEYVDRDVTLNQVYWYWLAQVSASQPERETFYGPVWGGVGPLAVPYRLYLPLLRKN